MGDYLSADALVAYANDGTDLPVDDVHDVFGGTVKIRALSASAQARIRAEAMEIDSRHAKINWAELERLTVKAGVIEPELSTEQVKLLHIKSGPSFTRVFDAINELSGTDKEALRKAEEEFPQPDSDEQ